MQGEALPGVWGCPGAYNAPLQAYAVTMQSASGGPGFGVSPKFSSLSPKSGGQGVDDALFGQPSEVKRQVEGD